MHADPPREPGWPEEHCSLCGRRTNHGIYVDEATARDAAVLLVRAGAIKPGRADLGANSGRPAEVASVPPRNRT